MRYGRPSIAEVIGKIAADGIKNLLLIPQYPHYAMSSWETVVQRVREESVRQAPALRVTCIAPFCADADYIAALHEVAKPFLAQPYDHLLFSYHGVPLRHLRKAGCSCGRSANVTACCAPGSPTYPTCYRAQVFATTHALAAKAGISPERYSISFQSRLGPEPWCQPFTDAELVRLAANGVNRLLVICPAFVADCLETLEEISVAGRETFLKAGGKSFQQIPCLNDHQAYIEFLAGRIGASLPGIMRSQRSEMERPRATHAQVDYATA
jgi:ferrochelatase